MRKYIFVLLAMSPMVFASQDSMDEDVFALFLQSLEERACGVVTRNRYSPLPDADMTCPITVSAMADQYMAFSKR